jgi:hypothetical protein
MATLADFDPGPTMPERNGLLIVDPHFGHRRFLANPRVSITSSSERFGC